MLLVIAQVKAKPGQSEALLHALKTYIDVVNANEPGTLYFDVHQKVLDGSDSLESYVILEGYADAAAYELHQASSYKPEHIGRIREHVLEASVEQFLRVDPGS